MNKFTETEWRFHNTDFTKEQSKLLRGGVHKMWTHTKFYEKAVQNYKWTWMSYVFMKQSHFIYDTSITIV